jgi:pimeloyl-ACP methyl ester carboxylesterase
MPFLTIPRGRIYYEESGSGYPVLLFAPGFLSSRIERWRSNPARPGVAQDWVDPMPVLAPHFRLVALDVRNAGESRAEITPDYDWNSYTADHLALLRHLGITRCHVMGACIGVSFAYSLAQAQPGLVSAMVLQNPIGLASNRDTVQGEFDQWAKQVATWPGVDAAILPEIGRRMFGGDFLFSVTRDFVASCDVPVFLMPGDDTMHPAETSGDILRLAPAAEQEYPWKGPQFREAAMQKALAFFLKHRPEQ